MAEIVMPRLSDTMAEGTVIRWLKGPGDSVRRGEPIVEIETDKATITYESDIDGVIDQILVTEGVTVPVGTTIATLQGAGAGVGAAAAAEPGLMAPQAPLPAQSTALPPQPVSAEPDLVPPGGAEPGLMPPGPAELGLMPPAAPEPDLAPPAAPAPAQSEPPLAAPSVTESDLQPPASGADGPEGRVKASPIARRLARKLGIDLATVTGTGPGGRIVKEDVEAAANAQAGGLAEPGGAAAPAQFEPEPLPAEPPLAAPAPPPSQEPEPFETEPFVPEPLPATPGPGAAAVPPPGITPVAPASLPTPGATGGFQAIQQPQTAPPVTAPVVGSTATRGQSTTVDPTQAQQIVARRMAEAKATIPEFQVEVDVDMTAATALREQLRYGVQPSPSVNDIVVKAAALALRQFPRVNGAYKDGRFEYFNDVNVGVVVSAGELLAVPTIFNADQKGLAQIAREAHELAAAVRGRQIQPAQLAGGTFTISNLGMFGVPRFNAIINPPQAGILAVGAIQRKPVVAEDGFQLQVRPVMTLTLSVDHRIVYGQEAAEFLGAIKSWLENPHALQV